VFGTVSLGADVAGGVLVSVEVDDGAGREVSVVESPLRSTLQAAATITAVVNIDRWCMGRSG
jgi:hypothetical protein